MKFILTELKNSNESISFRWEYLLLRRGKTIFDFEMFPSFFLYLLRSKRKEEILSYFLVTFVAGTRFFVSFIPVVRKKKEKINGTMHFAQVLKISTDPLYPTNVFIGRGSSLLLFLPPPLQSQPTFDWTSPFFR